MLFPLGSLLLLLLVVVGIWRGVEKWLDEHAELVEEIDELVVIRRRRRSDFLDGLKISWYQIVVIFAIGSVAGLILEQLWMFITEGLTERRYGLVWGPFSPLYGVGATLLTILCFELRKRQATWWQIFLISMLVGGGLEQVTGWGMETFMGATSWDYTNVPGCITKWVAWPFLFFWGILGLIWAKAVMPELLYRIGVPTRKRQVVFVALLALYLGFDIFMTLACFERVAARERGIPPQGVFEEWVDTKYSDQFVANRFQNMVFADPSA
ncbi:MAG: putative ABC transporter permease [Coriobacteriales bacterium]|nr:putative ABC transporter permease [Coriobacteriales bacterium]